MIDKIKNNPILSSFIFIFLLYLIDLGNVNGLRQGTEGFYLLISKNMRESLDLMTPHIYGSRHWSKPPLHFWLPLPFSIFFDSFLFSARLSILVFCLFITGIICKLIPRKEESIDYTLLLFFFGTIGFLKYSRIYMMEVPLMLLTTLASMYFFKIIERNRMDKYFWLGAISLGASILVKGPVSFVMIFLGAIAFCLSKGIEYFFSKFKISFLFFLIGALFGLWWFGLSYLNYGNEFYEYFFLRENAGKFTAQSYPIRRVFQGLLIFSAPWSILLLFDLKKFFHYLKNSWNEDFFRFSVFNFIFFFVIWLIPNQRSHHYAIPALVFFLLIFYPFLKSNFKRSQHLALNFSYIFIILLIITLSIIASLIFGSSLFVENYIYLITCFILITAIGFLFKKSDFRTHSIKLILTLSLLWSAFIPVFYLPIVPDDVVQLTLNKKVGVNFRKPFFIGEQIGQKVDIISDHNTQPYLNRGDLVILPRNKAKSIFKSPEYKHLKSWKTWRRGVKVSDVLKAIKSNSPEELYTYMSIVSK